VAKLTMPLHVLINQLSAIRLAVTLCCLVRYVRVHAQAAKGLPKVGIVYGGWSLSRPTLYRYKKRLFRGNRYLDEK
jgi:hypothetical protein